MMMMIMTTMNGNNSDSNNKMQAHMQCKAMSKNIQVKLKYSLNIDKHHRGWMYKTGCNI